jgi:hypothetical protein
MFKETMDHRSAPYSQGKWLARLSLVLMIFVMASCAAPVILETSPEPEPAQTPVSSPPPEPTTIQSELADIQYTIQVGAFSTTERAAAYAAGLMRKGLDAYYFIDEDGLCKVRFERFETKALARQRASELQTLGWIDDFFIAQPVFQRYQIDPQAALRKNIVKTAGRFIGTPYRWGGESALKGFDCSGLTMTVYRLNGLDLPRNSRAQFRSGTPVQRDDLQKGDLVFFATNGPKRVSHVGVFTGGGQFIHAPGQGKRIRVASLSDGYFNRRYMGARRYF